MSLIVILNSFFVGYVLGKRSREVEQGPYSYYCEAYSYSAWVEPKYNDHPEYGASLIFEEKYNRVFSPESIDCERVYNY